MPQIAQQDYLEYEVDLSTQEAERLPDSFKRAMFHHLRQGTLLDVVLVHNASGEDAKARILGYYSESGGDFYIYFADVISDAGLISWNFTEPEPEVEQTEE